jgi:hypothetical protein
MGKFLDYLNKKSVLKFLPFFLRVIISVALGTIIFPIVAIIEISVSPYNKINKVYLFK